MDSIVSSIVKSMSRYGLKKGTVQELLRNVALVVEGIKPSYLIDCCALSPAVAVQFLQCMRNSLIVSTMSGSRSGNNINKHIGHTKKSVNKVKKQLQDRLLLHRDLVVVDLLCGDVIITTRETLLLNLQQLEAERTDEIDENDQSALHARLVLVRCINNRLELFSSESVRVLRATLQECVTEMCSSLPSIHTDSAVVVVTPNAALLQRMGLPLFVGYMLGYPCVYCDTAIGKDEEGKAGEEAESKLREKEENAQGGDQLIYAECTCVPTVDQSLISDPRTVPYSKGDTCKVCTRSEQREISSSSSSSSSSTSVNATLSFTSLLKVTVRGTTSQCSYQKGPSSSSPSSFLIPPGVAVNILEFSVPTELLCQPLDFKCPRSYSSVYVKDVLELAIADISAKLADCIDRLNSGTVSATGTGSVSGNADSCNSSSSCSNRLTSGICCSITANSNSSSYGTEFCRSTQLLILDNVDVIRETVSVTSIVL